jgi:type II secretory pathway component GspD/PulD (secretin)
MKCGAWKARILWFRVLLVCAALALWLAPSSQAPAALRAPPTDARAELYRAPVDWSPPAAHPDVAEPPELRNALVSYRFLLRQERSLRLGRVPVHEAVDFLADVSGLNLVVEDELAEGMVWLTLGRVRLVDALEHVARACRARIEFRDEALHLVPRDRPPRTDVLELYDVPKLTALFPPRGLDLLALIRESTGGDEGWRGSSMELHRGVLIVSAEPELQAQVQRVLTSLRQRL